jgi:CHAT domain-containing protein/HEAT repeat protein
MSGEIIEACALLGTTPRAKRSGVYPVAISPTAPLLAEYVGWDQRPLRITNYDDQKIIGRFPADYKLHTLSFSPDGKLLLAIDQGLLICKEPWKARSHLRVQLPSRSFHGAWMDERTALIAGAKNSFTVWVAIYDVKRKDLKILDLELPEKLVYNNDQLFINDINHAFCSPSGLIGFSLVCHHYSPRSTYASALLFYQLVEERSAAHLEGRYFVDDYSARVAISEDGQTMLCVSGSERRSIYFIDRQGHVLDSLPCNTDRSDYWVTYRYDNVLVRQNNNPMSIYSVKGGTFRRWLELPTPGSNPYGNYYHSRQEIFVGYADLTETQGEMRIAVETKDGEQTAIYRLPDFDIVGLLSKKPDERFQAAVSLGSRRYRPAVNALTALINDPHPQVLEATIQALTEIGDPQSLPHLIGALGAGPSDEVQDLLLKSLACFPESDLSGAITEGLKEAEGGRRLGALLALERLPSIEAGDGLLEALAKPEAEIRMIAARALGIRHDHRAIPKLTMLLEDENANVQEVVIEALGKIGDPVTLPYLIRALGRQRDVDTPDKILTAINLFPKEEVRIAVLDCLAYPETARRSGAVRFLASSTDIEAIDELIEALSETNAQIRLFAACALAKRKNLRACVALLGRLNDEDPRARLAAQQALIDILDAAGLLSPQVIRRLSTPLNLASYATEVISRGRALDLAHFGDSLVAGFLNDLALAAPVGDGQLTGILNAIESMKAAGVEDPNGAKGIALTVALFCADAFRSKECWPAAMQIYQRAVQLSSEIGAPQIEWQAWQAIGACLERLGEDPIALEAYRQAMQVIDRWWFALLNEEELRGFFLDKAMLYDRAGLCALRLGHRALALEIVEKSKTRYLGDLIARRQRAPQAAVQGELVEYWGLGDRTLPVRTTIVESTTPEKKKAKIIGVTKSSEGIAVSAVKPERLAALEEAGRNNNDISFWIGMIQTIWELVTHLALRGKDPNLIHIETIYQALFSIRQAFNSGALPISPARRDLYLMQIEKAASALRATDETAANAPYWAFREYISFFRKLVDSTESAEYSLVLGAVMEALNLVLHHEPVMGAPDQSVAGGDDGFVFLTATDDESPRQLNERTTVVESAIERRAQTRWQYVSQVARGEISHFREISHSLRGSRDVAQAQFAVSEHGTVVYVIQGDEGDEPVNGLMPKLCGEDHLQVFSFPRLTLSALHSRLWQGPESWFARFRHGGRPGEQKALHDSIDGALQWLHAELMSPLGEHFKRLGVKRLRIIPHRALHLIPFAALYGADDHGRRHYLIDDYQIEYAPSATILRICQERQNGRDISPSLTVVADPSGDLPFANYEAEQVIRYFATSAVQAWPGEKARLSDVIGEAIGSVFHFSGHGRYQWDDPLKSSLIFAGMEALRLEDLFSEMITFRQTKLVVLSACETNVTDPQDLADEYLGLASGFLFGGTPAVISTLWAVNDLATALLMKEFYRLHLSEKQGIAAALRGAQQWLRSATAQQLNLVEYWERVYQSSGRRDADAFRAMRAYRANPKLCPFMRPYYWAAFTCQGV